MHRLVDAPWKQATRSLKYSGLGLRSAAEHAPAAYTASLGATTTLCKEVVPFYELDWQSRPDVAAAVSFINGRMPAYEQVNAEAALSKKQLDLSEALDKSAFHDRLATATTVDQATLRSECQPGARVFLEADPSEVLGLHFSPAELSASFEPGCACYKGTPTSAVLRAMASLMPKVFTLACARQGGDRTVRHNAVRG